MSFSSLRNCCSAVLRWGLNCGVFFILSVRDRWRFDFLLVPALSASSKIFYIEPVYTEMGDNWPYTVFDINWLPRRTRLGHPSAGRPNQNVVGRERRHGWQGAYPQYCIKLVFKNPAKSKHSCIYFYFPMIVLVPAGIADSFSEVTIHHWTQ